MIFYIYFLGKGIWLYRGGDFLKYNFCLEEMEEVIAPDLWTSIVNAFNSFLNGLVDGLSNGLIF